MLARNIDFTEINDPENPVHKKQNPNQRSQRLRLGLALIKVACAGEDDTDVQNALTEISQQTDIIEAVFDTS